MQPPDARAIASANETAYRTSRAYVALLFRVFPGKFVATLALIACVGFMEWLGLFLLAPLLQVVGVRLGEGTASRLADFGGGVLRHLGLTPTLAALLTVYLGVVAAGALLKRRQGIAITELESIFVRHLRGRLFLAVLGTRWIFLCRARSSTFLYALTNQAARVGEALDHLLPLVSQLLIVAVYLAFALTLAPVITLVVSATGVGLLLLLRPQARRAFGTGERNTRAVGRLYGGVVEQLGSLKTARSYGAEDRMARLFDRLQGEVVTSQMAAQRNFTRVKLAFEISAALLLCLTLFTSVELLHMALAEVLLLLYLMGRVLPRLSSLQQSQQYFVNSLPAFKDIMQVIEDCEAEADPRSLDTGEPIELHEAIRLRRVSFRYRSEADEATIHELDLDIPARRTTAIVGPSGAGKTTVADLVLGLVMPDSGHITVDGVPLGFGTMRRWRDQIGYVPQDGFLFHDTVRANLLWARPGATERDLHEALRLAAAEEFVGRLPRGLDTVIGDRGVLLSGGERQRLALAGALLRRPALLILDEATSSLDSENERQIQRAIEHLHGQATILVITHRLSTIREADAIHVIENGRLIESGRWPELIRANGRFADLCRAQRIPTEALCRAPTRMAATCR